MRAFEVAGPEIVRLHHVQVAVEDQKTVAGHVSHLQRFESQGSGVPAPQIISGSAREIKAPSGRRQVSARPALEYSPDCWEGRGGPTVENSPNPKTLDHQSNPGESQ